MLWKRVSEILNFQNLIFIFLSQNLEGEKIKTDFTKLNFFSQKQKPIRNFFFILTNRFDQIEIIFEQFRFWLVRGKLYFEKNLWKTYFSNFLTTEKRIFEWFQKWPRKSNHSITWVSDHGKNNLETEIMWLFSSFEKSFTKIQSVFSGWNSPNLVFLGKKF